MFKNIFETLSIILIVCFIAVCCCVNNISDFFISDGDTILLFLFIFLWVVGVIIAMVLLWKQSKIATLLYLCIHSILSVASFKGTCFFLEQMHLPKHGLTSIIMAAFDNIVAFFFLAILFLFYIWIDILLLCCFDKD